jgi:hypothetical protein
MAGSHKIQALLQRPAIRLALVVALLGLALAIPNRYALTVFHEANSAGRVYAIQSWVHYDSWSFEDILCRTGPQHGIVDLSIRKGKPLLQKAPGVSWLGIPVYALGVLIHGGKIPFHQASTLLGLFCVWLPGLLLIFALGRWLQGQFGNKWGLGATFALLAASPMWTYLPMFIDYALATLMLPIAYLCWQRERKLWWVLGGLLAGLTVVVNYMFLVYGGLLFILEIFFRWRRRKDPLPFLALTVAGGILPAVSIVIYHLLVWGHPFATAYDFMAYEIHVGMHGHVGFSWSVLADCFLHAKLGFLFNVPWVVAGWGGLIWLTRDESRRKHAIAGLLVTIATLLFVAYWRGTNTDDLAFNRHALPLLPWATLGLAAAVQALGRVPNLPRRLAYFALAGTIAVAFFYQFITAWTYPYHYDLLPSPLWQINLPLFLNGLLLTVVPGAPVLKGMVVVLDGAPWAWFGISVLLVASATLLALLAVRGKPERIKHMAALPGAFLLTLLLLMMWGVSTDVVNQETTTQSEVIAGKMATGQAVTDEEVKLLKSVRQARSFYEMAAFDVQGSVYTPQDVLWNDDGYPETNQWCR